MKFLESTKVAANQFLQAEKYEVALGMYGDLANMATPYITDGLKERAAMDKMIIALHLNMALVYLKLKKTEECVEHCEKIFIMDMTNEKALYRMGQVYLLRGDHEEALSYFKKVVRMHPENKEAAYQLKICQDGLARSLEQEKRMFQSAFRRLSNVSLSNSLSIFS